MRLSGPVMSNRNWLQIHAFFGKGEKKTEEKANQTLGNGSLFQVRNA